MKVRLDGRVLILDAETRNDGILIGQIRQECAGANADNRFIQVYGEIGLDERGVGEGDDYDLGDLHLVLETTKPEPTKP